MKIYKAKKEDGFTLVELMITLVVAAIISAAIYATYIVQQRSHTAQEAVAEMQQNIRAAMILMSQDIRMAGYAPDDGDFGFTNDDFDNGAGEPEHVTNSATSIAFTADLDGDNTIDRACEDINGDGNTDMSEMEQISYRLNNNNLERYSTTTGIIEWHIVAENIEEIEFNYILDNRSTTTPVLADLANIRAVQISILARASRPDSNFTNTMVYCPASNPLDPATGLCTDITATVWDPVDDNFRRRLLITTIQCRNMGL